MRKSSIGRTFLVSMMVVASGVALFFLLKATNRLSLTEIPKTSLSNETAIAAKPRAEVRTSLQDSSDSDISGDDSEARRLFETGLEKLGSGEVLLARRTFERIRRDFPDSPVAIRASFQLGKIFLKEGKKYEARG